jgi:hypothetical protein
MKYFAQAVAVAIASSSLFVAESAATDSAETIPFAAEVVRDDTPIHSGPGGRFYETNKLSSGTRVEVYRRDDSGWLAIRPLESSFSWIKSSSLRQTTDATIAAVLQDGTKSWIGSNRANTNGFHHQVTLKAGERVELLGKRTLPSNSGVLETWYKIAPPAGEFRWIHPGQLRLVEQTASSIARTSKELEFQRPRERQVNQSERVSTRPTTQTGFYEVGQETRTRLENSAFQNTASQNTASQNGERTVREAVTIGNSQFQEPQKLPIQVTQQAEKVGDNPTQSQVQIQVQPLTGDFEQQLRQVDVSLSLMVTKEASQWRFNDMRLQLAKLIQTGETPLQRGRARLLLEKLEEFAAHAIRRSEVASKQKNTTASVAPKREPSTTEVWLTLNRKSAKNLSVAPFDPQPSAVRQVAFETGTAIGTGIANRVEGDIKTVSVLASIADSTTTARPIVDETTYDGKGWLMPVYSRAGDAPRYALTDKNAKVLSFVTPAPGYNLHRYLKTRVGIYGQRSFLKDANTLHITAHRVINLDRHVRGE